jgi:signal transduction histidine kinase
MAGMTGVRTDYENAVAVRLRDLQAAAAALPDGGFTLRARLEALRCALASGRSTAAAALAARLAELAGACSGTADLSITRSPFDVPQLLAAVAARRTEATVLRVPNTLPVLADELLLDQAVSNLLENAIRHGAPPVELAAGCTSDGGVRLAISDCGFGPQLGGGRGLAFARAVAVAHGGSAGLDARDGGGTCAWLQLPAFGG